MPTKILTFNPLDEDGLEVVEQELDRLLNRGWKIVTSIGGNRSGRQGGRGPLRSEREVAASAPVSRDYVVLILHRRTDRPSILSDSESNISRLDEPQPDDPIRYANKPIKETT